MRRVSASFVIAIVVACSNPPEAGELGTPRFVGRVKGEVPLRIAPPIVDLGGNIYTAAGAVDFPEVSVTVSKFAGGESAPCTLTRGDKVGLHGWVGYASSQAWYWAGDLLVEVRGDTGACTPVLDVSPTSNSHLSFVGVMPFVYDAPSQTTVVAFIAAPGDPAPSVARVSLRDKTFVSLHDFEGVGISELNILGVGADLKEQLGLALVQWKVGDGVATEGRVYDAEANLVSAVRIDLPKLDAYAVRGYLARNPDGTIAGMVADDKLVLYDDASARVVAPPMPAAGVHRWGDELFLVGSASGHPALARIEGLGVGAPFRWAASEATNGSIAGTHDIRDDRTPPARTVTWNSVRNGAGEFPFVQPFSLTPYAPDTTLIPLAGPVFDGPTGKVTSLAVAPVGVTYP